MNFRKLTVLLFACSMVFSLGKNLKMGVVVKIGGIPWFNAMEDGMKEAGEKIGVDAFMIGPTSTDPALQVKAIEDLIAQKVDIIGVVPNDASVLEPVLKRAQSKGIVVLTHESPQQKYADYDFELVSPQRFGEIHARSFAKEINRQGQYAIYVGSLTVPLHNEWADHAINYIKKNYPKMKMVDSRYGVAESVDDSAKTTLDLLKKYPQLKGILTFGSQGPIGAGRVLQRKRNKSVKIFGTFSPSQGISLMKKGWLAGGYMWNPQTAGKIFSRLGKQIVEGYQPKNGDHIEGLNTITKTGNTLIGDNAVELNLKNVEALSKIGL